MIPLTDLVSRTRHGHIIRGASRVLVAALVGQSHAQLPQPTTPTPPAPASVNERLFAELVECMTEMNDSVRGERGPSREFRVDAIAIKALRSKLGLSQPKFAALLRERAQKIGGKFTAWSADGLGDGDSAQCSGCEGLRRRRGRTFLAHRRFSVRAGKQSP